MLKGTLFIFIPLEASIEALLWLVLYGFKTKPTMERRPDVWVGLAGWLGTSCACQ
jgi:hypothetical protein